MEKTNTTTAAEAPSPDQSRAEPSQDYWKTYNKYSNTLLARNIAINSSFLIQKKQTLEKYNRYAKWQVKEHMHTFRRSDFYNKISNALLTYDFVLKPEDHIKFVICDKFVQGAYQP